MVERIGGGITEDDRMIKLCRICEGQCGDVEIEVTRNNSRLGIFCSMACWGKWRREQGVITDVIE
jgi:hypothetical protein